MKILNIRKINNFGIFKNFDWNENLVYSDSKGKNHIYNFKNINIFYGRNYSGKTSLSKIIRSLETKYISNKYDTPSFEITLETGTVISPSNLFDFNFPIHVYNSDFVKENLKFIYDDTQNIESFSVALGDSNQQILDKIDELKKELGSNEIDGETGLYLLVKNKSLIFQDAKKDFKDKNNDLNKLLSNKATSGQDSIKYQLNKFGEQNYNVTKLKEIDIPKVLNAEYVALSKIQIVNYEQLISEKSKKNPDEVKDISINFSGMVSAVKEILTSQVGEASKIDELMQDSSLNRWVESGLNLHEQRSTCAFCSNNITKERLDTLRQHFDEESQKLKTRIKKGIEMLEASKRDLEFSLDINQYYENFHSTIEDIQQKIAEFLVKQVKSIDDLIGNLKKKEDKLFESISFTEPQNYLNQIEVLVGKAKSIREQHIALTSNLNSKQIEARNKLRLDHVYHFIQEIDYAKKIEEIDILKKNIEPLENNLKELEKARDYKIREIALEEDKLSSEGEACIRINDILNHEFGHSCLKLEAKETKDHFGKSIVFEIQRNGEKAHNLSEGECSLISFCYFLAKIQDDLEEGKKPIIWIDDPISSLDSNHIFFIYTLINEYLCRDKDFSQLFISTHNLEFLKYLKRLNVGFDDNGKTKNLIVNKYLVQRIDKNNSIIEKMPVYMSEYATEFNYLFKQIYTCATANLITDQNHSSFYNFGNNARKFIEIYSFYRFPTHMKDEKRLEKFWNDDNLYRLFIGRVTNEMSHFSGIFERGMLIIDEPEMQLVAKSIIKKVQTDIEQYDALLESIGIDKQSDELYPEFEGEIK